MKENLISRGDDQYRFRTTRWSVVLLSAQSQAPGFQVALSELYKIYWYPLYAYVRRRGHTPEEAQDLTQGFFLHLLEHKTLGRADPLKGKFREEVERTVSDPGDVDAEIHELCEALVVAEGWIVP